ncbi:MAG TPA: CinA family protein, partial [Verrucomicrobiae bacterium]|nr:CinA family protein [Verrucomicrobiae bacterium]
EKRQTLALAESCTGGWIANRLTNVPGASAVLLAGLVPYSNEAKQQFLGVRPETLATYGAVSEEVAREMAEGARTRTGSDYAVSVTGIAGPTGGTEDKPVGTVWMAVASSGKTIAKRRLNPYDRETFKSVTSQQALDLLRRNIR